MVSVEEGLPYGDRVWFFDARTPVRRMGVSTHPAQQVMVISLWQGDVCTGTFRLPLAAGARLISTVAEGMAAGLPQHRTDPWPPSASRPSWRSRVLTWFGWRRTAARRNLRSLTP